MNHGNKQIIQQGPILKVANNLSMDVSDKDNDFATNDVLQTVKSQFFQIYSSFLQQSGQPTSQEQIKWHMSNMSIYNSPQQAQKQNQSHSSQTVYQCRKQLSLNHSQIIIFQIRISIFQTKVSLLNIHGKNPFLKYAQSKKGNYGKVYFYTFLNTATAIKIFMFPNLKSISQVINEAIKQYSIMKICSSLKCAPFLYNTFGFDLIAYDDSVLFTMEKCQKIRMLSSQIIDELKRNMKVMHNHKIIHFDIKPDNIMMSQAQNRPIFIDFGFSQIIKENAGAKIRTFFRGSPAFCGEQMSSIIQKSQYKSLVDVYYNDMVSLNHSISYLRLELKGIVRQPQTFGDSFEDQQIQCNLMLVLLKYMLLTKRSQSIAMLLKKRNCILLVKYGNQVMKFFQNPIGVEAFQQLYEQLSEELIKYIQPIVLQNYFRHYYRTFSIYKRKNQENIISQIQELFLNRINFGSKELYCNIGHQKYKEFLQIQGVFKNPKYEEKSKHILIQALRFDFKNYSLDEKIEFSRKYNQIHDIQAQVNLESIKIAFKLLLQYCLAQPRSTWKRQHIFIIMAQLMIIDYNIEPLLPTFFETIVEMHQSFNNRITCSIELLKISYLMIFKHKSTYPCMIKAAPFKVYQFGKMIIQQTIQNYKDSENSEIQMVIMAFKQVLGPRRPDKMVDNYQKLKNTQSYINESLFKRELLYFLFLYGFQLNTTQKGYEKSYKMLHYIAQNSDQSAAQLTGYNLHYSIYFIANILILQKNYKELRRLFQNIIQSINCIEVSDKFKFQMCLFIFSDDRDQQKILKFSLELLHISETLSAVKMASQFSQMIEKIRKSPKFVKEHPQIMVRFSQTFAVLQRKSMPRVYILTPTQLQKIMYKYNIIAFLLIVNPSFHHTFITEIIDCLQSLLIQVGQNQGKERQIYLKFNLQAYLNILYYHIKQYKKLLQSFENLYDISKQIDNPIAKDYFLKEIIMTASIIPDLQKLKYYITLFFNTSRSITSLARYFELQGKFFIAVTLNHFQRIGQLQLFYTFLVDLAKFIAYFPNEVNFKHFTSNIEKLMGVQGYLSLMQFDKLVRINKQNGQGCHYFVFYYIYSIQVEENKEKKQFIFSKISKNIGYLHYYMKEFILHKCFYHIISCCSDQKRKNSYLYLRFGFKYSRNEELRMHLAKTLKKLKRNSQSFSLIQSYALKIQQALRT